MEEEQEVQQTFTYTIKFKSLEFQSISAPTPEAISVSFVTASQNQYTTKSYWPALSANNKVQFLSESYT
jgi:hypothetical protein